MSNHEVVVLRSRYSDNVPGVGKPLKVKDWSLGASGAGVLFRKAGA
jgi:hypothetical protein